MRRAVIVALAALLAGCAGQVRTIQIEVPVPVYCEPPEIPTPALPIDALEPTADVFEVTRALWATVELLEGHVGELRAAIEACRER